MTIETQNTLESTRRLANQAMERASNTVKDLRSGVSERASAAKSYMGEYAGVGTRYVADHPLKTALIAAAIGAAVAGLVLALRHHRDNEKYF